MGWTTLVVSALGLALFLEGLPYFISPEMTRVTLERLARMSDVVLRGIGLALMVAGLAVVYLSLH